MKRYLMCFEFPKFEKCVLNNSEHVMKVNMQPNKNSYKSGYWEQGVSTIDSLSQDLHISLFDTLSWMNLRNYAIFNKHS